MTTITHTHTFTYVTYIERERGKEKKISEARRLPFCGIPLDFVALAADTQQGRERFPWCSWQLHKRADHDGVVAVSGDASSSKTHIEQI